MLVVTMGRGVHGFTLDPEIGAFTLTHPDMRIPEDTREFAINTSNARFWEPPVQRYVDECVKGRNGPRAADFNMRWIASMVAEVHRILVRGGAVHVPEGHQGPGQARPAAPAVRGQSDGDAGRAGGRPAPAPAARGCSTSCRRTCTSGCRSSWARATRSSASSAITGRTTPARTRSSSRRCSTCGRCSAPRLGDQSCRSGIRSSPSPVRRARGPRPSPAPSSTSSAARRLSAAIVEGDSFHRYDRTEMKAKMAEAAAAGNANFSHFGPEANRLEDLEALFRAYGETRHRQGAQVPARRAGGRALRPGARHVHAVGRRSRRHRPAVLRGPARRRGHRPRQHRGAGRPADRRGADHQPRVDPEAAPRPEPARLLAGRGRRHHPAPDAGLRELHLPAVLADAHQFPARADGRHVEPLHRQGHPDRSTRAWS